MANPGWYNDNEFRDWPFMTRTLPLDEYVVPGGNPSSSQSLAGSYHVPHATIVDFGAIMDIDADYNEYAGHFIWLHSITRSGTTFEFSFRTTAPGALSQEVIFTREITAEDYEIEWADSSSFEVEEIDPLNCADQSPWRAFMVNGPLEDLIELLPGDGSITFPVGLWYVEPSRTQSLMQSYLRAVNLANFPRTLVKPPDGCGSLSSSAGSDEPILAASCMRGNIKWKEGYNCSIRQDNRDNAIIIGAGQGAGEGEPCDEVPLYEGEAPPEGSPHLSGGPGCSEVVKTINGIGGRDIFITAGPGFRVQQDTEDPNTLNLNRALDDFAACLAEEETLSSSLSSSSSQGSLGSA